MAVSHDPDVAEESAQKAWGNAWRNLERVRDPGSFVRWAGQIARREVTRLSQQAREQSEIGREALLAPPESRAQFSTEGAMTNRAAMTPEMRTTFEQVIRQCLRGEQQQRVIIALLLEQRSGKEVAEELGKSPQYIYEVKSRALARLKQCEAMRGLYEEIIEP
jgi:RNA polymerase sigma factor (sigma-70 family)